MATASSTGLGVAKVEEKTVCAPLATPLVTVVVGAKGSTGAFRAVASKAPTAVVTGVVNSGSVGVGKTPCPPSVGKAGVGKILCPNGVGMGVGTTKLAPWFGSLGEMGNVLVGPGMVPVRGGAKGSTKGVGGAKGSMVGVGSAKGSMVGVAKGAKGSVIAWVAVSGVVVVRPVVGVKGLVGVTRGVGVGVGWAEIPRP